MATIWKFPLKLISVQQVEMPMGARILSAHMQRGIPCIWAEISDPKAPKEAKEIHIIGTGHEFNNSGLVPIGTTMTDDHSLVWHIYEKR